jgi:hypothetical protein
MIFIAVSITAIAGHQPVTVLPVVFFVIGYVVTKLDIVFSGFSRHSLFKLKTLFSQPGFERIQKASL